MSATTHLTGVSLFSGCGGLDLGARMAGIEVVWANDNNKNACHSYQDNFGDCIHQGDIEAFLPSLEKYREAAIDVVFGGPPCQGFSVAGKMQKSDPRNKLLWSFCEAVGIVQPRAFVLENVKALGTLQRWEAVREELLDRLREHGYTVLTRVLTASRFGVPQNRERFFVIGFRDDPTFAEARFDALLEAYACPTMTVREVLQPLDPAGTGSNASLCTAKITMARKPVLRKSPYAGMLFNGSGRPIDLDSQAMTMTASLGGNKTPIIDEMALHNSEEVPWVVGYHQKLQSSAPLPEIVPPRLRRLTVEEASILQSFPNDFRLSGSQCARFQQVGNAVPPKLAEAVLGAIAQQLKK